MPKKYDVIASVGEYQDQNGQTKTKWLKCGVVIENPESGNLSLKMEALPVGEEWSGWFSLKVPTPRDQMPNSGQGGYQQQQPPQQQGYRQPAPQPQQPAPQQGGYPAADFDDKDLPF